jgi:hypothetical protein
VILLCENPKKKLLKGDVNTPSVSQKRVE